MTLNIFFFNIELWLASHLFSSIPLDASKPLIFKAANRNTTSIY